MVGTENRCRWYMLQRERSNQENISNLMWKGSNRKVTIVRDKWSLEREKITNDEWNEEVGLMLLVVDYLVLSISSLLLIISH